MPTAKCCGKKLDRNQDVLVCRGCNQMLHPGCVGISADEYLHYSTSDYGFKCQECYSARRKSCLNSPPIQPHSAFSTATEQFASENMLTDAILIEPPNPDAESQVESPMSSNGCGKDSLALILQELVKLRASHRELYGIVVGLRADNASLKADNAELKSNNANLMEKITDVQQKLNSLVVLNNVRAETVSPKRKKTSVAKPTANVNVNKLSTTPSTSAVDETQLPITSDMDEFPRLPNRQECPAILNWTRVVRSRKNSITNFNTITNSAEL